MNENDHDTEDHKEDYVNPYVLETRRIREEIRHEFNHDSHAYIEYANRKAEARGILSSPPPPPPAFPPSQEWLDFLAMRTKQIANEQRRREAAGARHAGATVRAATAVHAAI
jgi:hypothetical protein